MNKYQSTLLAQDSTKEEIQKADLDLLGKINSVIDGMPSGSNTGLDAEVNILKAEIIPVSDIGRLTEISGDGIPNMPDGTAIQRVSYFTAVPSGWSAYLSITSTFTSGIWHVTGVLNCAYYLTGVTGIVRVKIRVLAGRIAYGLDSAPVLDTDRNWHYIITTMSGGTYQIGNSIANSVFEIADLYIGTGVYSSPLNDKSGNVIWTNNGLLPVDGYSGKGLLCNGSGYAVANSPVIGTVGTLAIDFLCTDFSNSPILFSNSNDTTSGFHLLISPSGELNFRNGADPLHDFVTNKKIVLNKRQTVFIRILTAQTISIMINGIVENYTLNANLISGILNLYLARYATGSSLFFNGTIYNFKAWSRVLSDDECISWANDPAGVDSKAPYQLSIDFTGLPTYADKATANAASYYGAFKTSSGLLGYAG